MSTRPLEGYTIGVTADRRSDEQMRLLADLGAECVHGPVITTRPVGGSGGGVGSGDRASLPADTSAAERLIRSVIDRRIDGLTFTAKTAVERFLAIATTVGVRDELVEALETVGVFCIGPVCASGFDELPRVEPFVPERRRLGAMVQQIAAEYARRGSVYDLGGTRVRVQGRLVVIDAESASPDVAYLSERERALLDALLERPGAVHSKRDLLRRVWRGSETDEHLVEVTVARLRQRLGRASDGIETVVRRGYRVGFG